MKVTKELLSKKSNLLRPYKSRTQRPCDFCRKRKTCCIIEKSIPCTLCIKFNKGVCTFNEGPVKRVNRNTLPKARVKREDYEPFFDSPRIPAPSYKESLAKEDRDLAGSLLINRGKHIAGLDLPGLKIPALASQSLPLSQNYLLSYNTSQPQLVGNTLYDYQPQLEVADNTKRFSIDKTSLSLSVETISTIFDTRSLLSYSLPLFLAAHKDFMPSIPVVQNSFTPFQQGLNKNAPPLQYANNLPPHTFGYEEFAKPVLSYDDAAVYEPQTFEAFKGLPSTNTNELHYYDF